MHVFCIPCISQIHVFTQNNIITLTLPLTRTHSLHHITQREVHTYTFIHSYIHTINRTELCVKCVHILYYY